jgi:hypothetical protein
MRINSRKIRKILRRVWTAPKRIFETFCTQEPLDASAWMQHSQLCFDSENQTKDFSYTIFPVKKINVGKVLKLWENCYLIILSIHILKLEISGCDRYQVWMKKIRVEELFVTEYWIELSIYVNRCWAKLLALSDCYEVHDEVSITNMTSFGLISYLLKNIWERNY